MNAWRSLSRSLLLLMLAFALGGCQKDARAPLRIGINPWPGYEFLYLARELDLFAAEGIDVQIVEYNSLPDALHAFQRGQLDGMGATLIEVLMARSDSDHKAVIAYVTDYSNGADVIVANSYVPDVAALKGKRVGVELGSLGVFLLARALERSGLTLDDVRAVSTDQLSMERKLAVGALDAVVTYPPFAVSVSALPGAHRIFSSAELPGEIVDVIAFDQEILKTRRADAAALIRTFQRAQRWAKEQPQKAYEIMARREGLTPEAFHQALTEGIALPSPQEQEALLRKGGSIADALVRANDILMHSGQMTTSGDPEHAFTDMLIDPQHRE